MKLEKILKNRYVYYVAVFLMVLNVLGYVANGSMECVIIFALSTYLSNQFLTKNPTLDILVGLLVSNALFGCKSAVKEGMDAHEGASKKTGVAAAATGSEFKSASNEAACKPHDKKCHEKAKLKALAHTKALETHKVTKAAAAK